VLSVILVLLAAAVPALAQQRPLLTEDPETIGAGTVLIEGGFDGQRDVFYPASGLEGNLLRLPTLGVSFGLSSIAELQIDGGFYNRLAVTGREPAPLSGMLDFSGDHTTDVEGGLGLDTTDFFASALIGKTVQSVRIVGNAGLGILGDPTRGDRQNDVLTYGVSFARAVRQGVEVVGEVNGRWATASDAATPPGTESRAAMRVGGRITRGTVRVDAGVIVGMTAEDPGIGFTAGLTWVFRGFTVP
jgi:hypothetical protein